MTGEYSYGVANEAQLGPFTQKIKPIEFHSAELGTIVLIDTPGFDYSEDNDEYVRSSQLRKWFQDKLESSSLYAARIN